MQNESFAKQSRTKKNIRESATLSSTVRGSISCSIETTNLIRNFLNGNKELRQGCLLTIPGDWKRTNSMHPCCENSNARKMPRLTTTGSKRSAQKFGNDESLL